MQLGLPAQVENAVAILGDAAGGIGLHAYRDERVGCRVEHSHTVAPGHIVDTAQAPQDAFLGKAIEMSCCFARRVVVKKREEQPFVVSDCLALCKNVGR